MTSLKPKVTTYERPSSRPTSPFKATVSQSAISTRDKIKIKTSVVNGLRQKEISASPTTIKAHIPPSRTPSPFKPSQRIENQTLPDSASIRVRIHAPKSSLSISSHTAPVIPNGGRSNPPLPNAHKRRTSLTHSKSNVTLVSRTTSSPLVPGSLPVDVDNLDSGSSLSQNTLPRITSRITHIVKSASPGEPRSSSPSPPLNFLVRSKSSRPRVPSVSNIAMFSPPPPPAASPPSSYLSNLTKHKRTFSQTSKESVYQPFQVDLNDNNVDDQKPHRNASILHRSPPVAKVDLTSIPISTQPSSPPGSNVSFSSFSSHSSTSFDDTHYSGTRGASPTLSPRLNGEIKEADGTRRASFGREGSPTSETDDDQATSDRRIKAQAKSIRKIADLEITNRSLMVINATLEAAKHRQAKEIRDLKRKLRESRLILPPRKYQQVKSSSDHDDTADEDEDDEDEDVDDEAEIDIQDDKDDGFRRVKTILETLLDQGRRALAIKPDDMDHGSKVSTKVLHAEELKSWRGSDDALNSLTPPIANGRQLDSDDDRHDISEADITPLPDSDDYGSEEEVEGMISIRITPSVS